MQVASIIQAVMDTDVHVRMNAPNPATSTNNNTDGNSILLNCLHNNLHLNIF